jgi:hypothetical protein
MSEGAKTVETGNKRRFAAFISYAHADASIAAKLQSRLERYRLPKHIAAAHAGGAAALGQIFRDREDLAAAPSLSDAIQAAIGEAEALVVIASPDAKASRWVGEEIALFRQLHPNRPILAAIVRGEPDDAFPDALTENGNEPLAADLRAEGDGEALGFLKIVAGIAGVPLDALVQRDAQRRLRRVTWITAGALAAMLVMGVMTTLAIQARNEAARQRAEAEGLVEYMLTDLREKLKGVNRLDAMQGVNRRAMEHYRRQGDLASLPADSLERRARILHAMGEDDDRDGKLDTAQTKFKEAHRTTAALLARQPANADRIFAHAQSEYWVGYAAWRKADLPTTERYWRNYLQQAEALHRSEPGTTRSLMELGYANGNLCDLIMRAKQSVELAIGYCGKAVEYERKALTQKPDDAKIGKDLANRIGWLSETLVSRNEFDRAIALRREEQAIIDRLLKSDPRNFELQLRSIAPVIGIGWAEYSRQQFGTAASHFKAALADLDALAKAFPNDQLVTVTRVRAAIMLAMAQRSTGNPEWPVSREKAGEYAANAKRMAQPEALTRVTEILAKFDRETRK